MAQSPPPRLTVVSAPIGYGKTTILSMWLRRANLPEGQTIWVHCPPRRPHFQTVQGLPPRTPFWQICAESLAEVLGKPLPQHTATFETVYRLASQIRTPHTLIIDDYHRDTTAITDYEIAELATLNVPLHILVLARRLCVLDGPLVVGREGVRLITQTDLAFNEAETTELLENVGVARTPTVDRFLAGVHGWPLAVAAALAGPREGTVRATESHAPGSATASESIAALADLEANLGRFVLHQVEVMSVNARTLLLCSALLGSMSIELAGNFTGLSFDAATTALFELVERGMVVSITEHTPSDQSSPHGVSEFCCHAALRPALIPLAERAFDLAERARLRAQRAVELTTEDPLSAFLLFCEAEAYAEAEAVLTKHFGLLMGEEAVVKPALRLIPRAALLAHPAFVSARLFLETDEPTLPPATLQRLSVLLHRGVTAQLTAHASSLGFWPAERGRKLLNIDDLAGEDAVALLRAVPLPLLAQAMASTRLLGNLRGAHALAVKLELRISATPMSDTGVTAPVSHDQVSDVHISRSELLLYQREIALTAIECGDLVQARRVWDRMQSTAIEFTSPPRHGAATTAHLSENVGHIGERWLQAAIQGRAFTEASEGNFAQSTQLLAQADLIAARTGLRPPGSSWITGAIARYTVTAESPLGQSAAAELAQLPLLMDRIEPWALVLTADTTAVQREHGAQWSIEHLEASHRQNDRGLGCAGEWHVRFASLHAQLCTVLGNFAAAERIITQMPAGHVSTLVEKARLAVFAGDDLQAIMITAGIGDSGTTVRQRADRSLIRAVADWHLGQQQEFATSLASALQFLDESGLRSPLWGVPFDALTAIMAGAHDVGSPLADAARHAAGMRILDQVPQTTRTARFEQLTEMELQTLHTLAGHRTIAETAQAMFVTLATVKKHLNSVYRKLRVRNRGEAMLQASRMGLIQVVAPNPKRLDATN